MKYTQPPKPLKRISCQEVLLTILLLIITQTGYSQILPKDPEKPKPPTTHTHSSTQQSSLQQDDNIVFVQGGTFKMGSNAAESLNAEKPAHSVTVSSFYISKYLVTQAQWQAVMANNPSSNKCDNCPVENISWDDAQTYCKRQRRLTGKTWRLPTEAEWEYAARGGNRSHGFTYSGSNDIEDVGWSSVNSGGINATALPGYLP
jgi:formylglycine-generating enzyme required for sulfatase activity